MIRFIKNLIIFVVFSLYLFYMVNNYLNYKENKNLLLNNQTGVNEVLDNVEEKNEIIETNEPHEEIVINNKDKVLFSDQTDYDKYLVLGKERAINNFISLSTKSNIDQIKEDLDNDEVFKNDDLNKYKDIINRDFDLDNLSFERKIFLKTMITIINNFNNKEYKKNSEIYSIDDYQDLLKGIMFYGDSQVGVMRAYNNKLRLFMHSLGGGNLKEQYDDIDKVLNEDLEVIVFFNGYNIGKHKDADEYIEDYKLIINKIHEYNKDIKIFITSLLPAREDVVLEDIKSTGVKYNYYNGPIFDKKLKETFNDIEEAVYIDTNWSVIERFYDSVDGVHFVPEFYWAYIPYVVSYVYFVLSS